MTHLIRFVQQYSGTLVDPYGRRYVARVYSSRRPDDRWDGWFVFFPLDGGRALATDRETTQGSLAAVRYWASGITTMYLDGALERALRLQPEAVLARRRARAEGEEALARAEAVAYEEAAHAARLEALDADRRRREAEAQLLAEREAAARAAARLHDQAAASARKEAVDADRRRREAEAQLLAEREASALAAARLHDQAAASALNEASEANRCRREFIRQHSSASRASRQRARAAAPDRARTPRRRKQKSA